LYTAQEWYIRRNRKLRLRIRDLCDQITDIASYMSVPAVMCVKCGQMPRWHIC
jgi:hypothetical protein